MKREIFKLIESLDNVEAPRIVNDAPVILEYDSTIIDSLVLDENTKIEESTTVYNEFDDLKMKYSDQLKSLKNMGFLCDDEVLSLILEQVNGNLEEAVVILIQNSSTM